MVILENINPGIDETSDNALRAGFYHITPKSGIVNLTVAGTEMLCHFSRNQYQLRYWGNWC